MISIDTNVLVRILVDDPGQPEQVKNARDQVRRSENVFVTQIVQVETVWVLETSYGLDRKTVLSILEHLACNRCFELEQDDYYEQALQMYRLGKADFSDYLILAASRKRNCVVLTFDKRFGRSKGVKLVTA